MALRRFQHGREALIQKSRVREVFTPHTPIKSADLFFGRQSELDRLIAQINTPGRHGLLWGERGVGKSSLANIAASLLQSQMRGGLHVKRCDSWDTFPSIVSYPLAACGWDVQVLQETRTSRHGGSAKINVAFVGVGAGRDQSVSQTIAGAGANAASPSWVAEQLAGYKALFVIDEGDAISHKEDRWKLAELGKILSDMGSPFKLLLVGIADAATDLVAGHPSLQRSLMETKVPRMSNEELDEIVEGGARKLKLNFDPVASRTIVELSAGYPHFAHLLALKSAEETIAGGRHLVLENDLQRAQRSAVDEAEATLKHAYESAVRSATTEKYRMVVIAAAACKGPEFSIQQIREKVESLFAVTLTQAALNNYLRRLVKNDTSALMCRVATGMYRFTDPRMPSFVRIAEANAHRR